MAQTYTLEEAADKLGLSPSDFKRRLREDNEFKSLKQFRDGTNLRFMATQIDELARRLGVGSDGDGPAPVVQVESFDLDLDEPTPPPPPAPKAPKVDAPLFADLDDDEVLAGLAASPGKPVPPPPPVAPVKKKGEADSDVRIETVGSSGRGGKANVATEEEIDFDLPPPAGSSGVISSGSSSQRLKNPASGKLVPTSQGGSGKLGPAPASSTKLKTPEKGGSGKIPKVPIPPPSDLNSEFELSLEDSDFELQLSDDSEEVSLGEISTSREPRPGESGINLGKPSDSGISLESKKSKPKSEKIAPKPAPADPGSDEDIDFELSLDVGASSSKLGGPKSAKIQDDSDSEFELSLDDSDSAAALSDPTSAFQAEEDNKDIFETDFEIPALDDDSASEAIALDEGDTDLENSDFDLALDDSDASSDDESASEVVVLDEDEEDEPKKRPRNRAASVGDALSKAGRKKVVDDEDDEDVVLDDYEEGESASAALRGVRDDDDDDDDVPAGPMVPAKSQPWGGFTVAMLFMTVPVLFLGGLMGFEVLQGMWGYQQPNRPVSPIVQFLAEKFDVAPKQ